MALLCQLYGPTSYSTNVQCIPQFNIHVLLKSRVVLWLHVRYKCVGDMHAWFR